MRDKILGALRRLESEQQCRILFAAESGSRAWGFASPDSDYDIRAIYVKDENWYWSLEEKPQDAFDAMLPDDMDVAAWELRKTLRLFAGCNLALNEWLGSPIVYCAAPEFYRAMQVLLPAFFNPVKAVHHYVAMSDQGMSDIAADGTIAVKKLFYGLRGLFAALWAEKYQTMPPTEFDGMLNLELLPDSILQTVFGLREIKRQAKEKERIAVPMELLLFCQNRREEVKRAIEGRKYLRPPLLELNRFFRATVQRQMQSFGGK